MVEEGVTRPQPANNRLVLLACTAAAVLCLSISVLLAVTHPAVHKAVDQVRLHLSPEGHLQRRQEDFISRYDPTERMIIVARFREDISWITEWLGDIPLKVYVAKNDGATHSTHGAGKEANAYIQFIVDHYENLPKVMLFMHAHECAWHFPHKVPMFRALRWDQVEELGYVSTRFKYLLWDPLTLPVPIKPPPPGSDLRWLAEEWFDPANDEDKDHEKHGYGVALSAMWHANNLTQHLGFKIPRHVTFDCCAEFLVHRSRILAQPKSFWETLLRWLHETQDEYWAGMAFELAWEMLMGNGPEHVWHIGGCHLYQCDKDGKHPFDHRLLQWPVEC